MISSEGNTANPKNILAVTSKISKKPKTISGLRTLLGFVGYLKKYTPNFSKTTSPLYQLLKGQPEKSCKAPIEWEKKHQSAINILLNQITNPPILAYPDFSKPFIHHTDASGQGIGCALYQYQNDELWVLGYGSRTLVGAEMKYHSSKLGFLALKWSICEHFRDYLFYTDHFDAYIDFNPLVYLKSNCKLNATGQRWINEMNDYHFSVHYKPGTENNVALADFQFSH